MLTPLDHLEPSAQRVRVRVASVPLEMEASLIVEIAQDRGGLL